MAIGNTTQLSGAIREAYQPGVVDAVYRNNQLFGIQVEGIGPVFPQIASQGDTAHKWKLNSAGNTSVATYSEGDAAPVAVAQSYVNASLSYTYLQASIQITGHLRDALKSAWFPAIEFEMQKAQMDMADLATTTMLNGTAGLQEAIDSGTTYAGISRGSAGYFEATETNLGGALTVAAFRDLDEAARDNDKGASNRAFWLMPLNQETNAAGLFGAAGGTTPAVRVMSNVGEKWNVGFEPAKMYAQGLPIVTIGDMTDTVILRIDASPGMWNLVIHRPFEVKELGASGDSDKFLLTSAFALPCYSPKQQAKLTGVTA